MDKTTKKIILTTQDNGLVAQKHIMKELTEIEQKMFDWDNELRFYSSEYSVEKVTEVA